MYRLPGKGPSQNKWEKHLNERLRDTTFQQTSDKVKQLRPRPMKLLMMPVPKLAKAILFGKTKQ